MHLLELGYGVILFAWIIFQVRSLAKDGFPHFVIAAEALAGVMLLFGLLSFGSSRLPTFSPQWWRVILALLLVAESALRVWTVRYEPFDVEVSTGVNRAIVGIAVVVELALIVPAIYLINTSVPPTAWRTGYLLPRGLAIALGLSIGWFLPRFPGLPLTNAQSKFVEYLCSPLEYDAPPDEIHTIDSRHRRWPGRKGNVFCTLFRFRYGDEWGVGLVGPFIFSLDFQSDEPVEGLYEKFEEFDYRIVGSRNRGLDLEE